jgi:hypothetical protein
MMVVEDVPLDMNVALKMQTMTHLMPITAKLHRPRPWQTI